MGATKTAIGLAALLGMTQPANSHPLLRQLHHRLDDSFTITNADTTDYNLTLQEYPSGVTLQYQGLEVTGGYWPVAHVLIEPAPASLPELYRVLDTQPLPIQSIAVFLEQAGALNSREESDVIAGLRTPALRYMVTPPVELSPSTMSAIKALYK